MVWSDLLDRNEISELQTVNCLWLAVMVTAMLEGSDPVVGHLPLAACTIPWAVFPRFLVLVNLQGALLRGCCSSVVKVLRLSDCAIVSLVRREGAMEQRRAGEGLPEREKHHGFLAK